MIISIIIVIIAIIAFLFSPKRGESLAPTGVRQETITPQPIQEKPREQDTTRQEEKQHTTSVARDSVPSPDSAKVPRKKVSFASRAEVRQFNIDTNQIVREYVRET